MSITIDYRSSLQACWGCVIGYWLPVLSRSIQSEFPHSVAKQMGKGDDRQQNPFLRESQPDQHANGRSHGWY